MDAKSVHRLGKLRAVVPDPLQLGEPPVSYAFIPSRAICSPS